MKGLKSQEVELDWWPSSGLCTAWSLLGFRSVAEAVDGLARVTVAVAAQSELISHNWKTASLHSFPAATGPPLVGFLRPR